MSRMCLMPFSHIVVTETGTVSPCCKFDIQKKNPSWKEHTLYNKNIEELFYQPAMENLRTQFLNGEEPIECNACWVEEKAGIKSLREHRTGLTQTRAHSSKYKNIQTDPRIVTIDFKFSSLCNLKCRICGPYLSSTWLKEASELKTYDEDVIQSFTKNAERKFFENETNFEIFKQILPQLHILEFYGGEPFMQPEHEKIMNILNDYQGIENINLELFYNTNGTYYNDSLTQIWKKMGSVELNISLDDIEGRYEYQRHPAKWSRVVENVEQFKRNCSPNVNISLYVTISLYNIFYLADFLVYNANNFKLPIRFNLVHYPTHMSVVHLPNTIKSIVSAKLKALTDNEIMYVDQTQGFTIDNVLQFMNDNLRSEDLWQKFLDTTEKHDAYRNESFHVTFTEFVNHFKNE